MIQFIRFETIDPVGYALVKLSDISSFQTHHSEKEYCRLTTAHGDFLVRGNIEHFSECLQSWVGTEWDGTPEKQP